MVRIQHSLEISLLISPFKPGNLKLYGILAIQHQNVGILTYSVLRFLTGK